MNIQWILFDIPVDGKQLFNILVNMFEKLKFLNIDVS